MTRALQSIPFQNPREEVWAWLRTDKQTEILVFNIGWRKWQKYAFKVYILTFKTLRIGLYSHFISVTRNANLVEILHFARGVMLLAIKNLFRIGHIVFTGTCWYFIAENNYFTTKILGKICTLTFVLINFSNKMVEKRGTAEKIHEILVYYSDSFMKKLVDKLIENSGLCFT